MKTIRLFGIALLTVLLSVSFSSCSKSDGDDNGHEGNTPSTAKRIKKCVENKKDNTYTYEYAYDGQGRLIQMKYSRTGKYGDKKSIHTFSYEGNTIVEKTTNGSEVITYTLKDELIVKIKDSDTEKTITYNNGYMASWGDERYTWANGNLIKVGNNYDSCTYEYTNLPAPSQSFRGLMSDWVMIAFYGGKTPKNLPQKSTTSPDGKVEVYEWVMKDGLPTQCTIGFDVYTFEWE